MKKVVITTLDNVEIYEGQSSGFWVHPKTLKFAEYYSETPLTEMYWGKDLTTLKKVKDRYVIFASKEQALDYIMMNKPSLSIVDVLNVAFNPVETKTSSIRKLKRIIRQKT